MLARKGRSGARAHSVPGGIPHGRLGDAVVPGERQLQLADGATLFQRLRSTGNLRAAGRALRQSHTLPPRSGNAAAAVAGAPNANLLVLTHNGFCAHCRARPWWQLLVHRQLLVRTVVVPAAEVPPPQNWPAGWIGP